MEYKKLDDIIEFNPIENLKKGTKAKKISMDKLGTFSKYINSFEREEFNGGMKFRNGDTLLARITPCLENGKTSKVTILDKNEVGFGSTEYIVMRSKKNISDEDFIFYLAISPKFRKIAIKSMTGTSGRQRVQLDVVKNTEMLIPSYEEQTKIGRILSKIDKKIELNSQINDNLYNLLNETFKYWFETFDKFNEQEFIKTEIGNIPKEFKVIELNDLIDIKGGLAYKASKLSENKENNILVSMGNVELNNLFNFNNLKYYDDNVDDKYIADCGDLFICTRDVTQQRNQLGCPGIIPKIFKDRNIIIGTNLYRVYYKKFNKELNRYLFLLLNSFRYRERIVGSAKGTAVLMIAKDDILKFKFAFPENSQILVEFNNIINPLFDKIENNISENKELTQLRDTLLPKLMNGEIDLENIEI